MRCTPSQKNPRVWAIITALIIFGGISYAIPILCAENGLSVPPALFQLATVLSLAAAVFVTVRYQMTEFVYLIRPRSDISENGMEIVYAGTADSFGITRLPPDMLDFVVIKSQGSRAGTAECVLSLSDLAAVLPLAKDGETKKSIRERYQADGYVSYDYTITLGVTDVLALVFIDGNRYAGIFIEPDEAMRAYFMSLGKTGRNKNKGVSH